MKHLRKKLVRKYDGNMTELPMIRVTTYYGAQHIGVSASEYEKLTRERCESVGA